MEEEKKKISKQQKYKFPKKKTDRILIYGVHPEDIREPKKEYCFWCSNYLMEQLPCIGDLVTVRIQKRKRDGNIGTFYKVLYITDLEKWEEGKIEPVSIAMALFKGKKTYQEFEYDIEE